MKKLNRIRLLALLLALCLMPLPLAGLAEAPAEAPGEYFGRRLVDSNGRVNSLAVVDGVAYALTDTALYTIHPGDSEAKLAGNLPRVYNASKTDRPSADVLLAQDGKLLGLNRQNGVLYELKVDGQGIAFTEYLKLNWEPFLVSEGEHSYTNAPMFTMLHEGRLYLKLENYSNDKEKDLISYDLKTGGHRLHEVRHLNTFIPYKDGKLLCMQFDQNQQDPQTGEQHPAEAVLFDPATDKVEPAGLKLKDTKEVRYDGLMLHYDAQKDRLYAADNFGIYLITGDKEPEMVARLPMAGAWLGHYSSMPFQPWGKDELLLGFGYHLFRRGTDPSQMKPVTSLKVNLGMLRSDALSLTQIQNEDIELVPYAEDWLENEKVAQLFLTKEMDLDVMVLETGTADVQRLIQKGYLAPLDGDPALKAIGEGLFPTFQPVTQDQGRLYALPLRIDGSYISYKPERFKDIGREAPRSMDELIDLVDWWAKEGAKANPDYALFDQAGAKWMLSSMTYEQYLDSQFGQSKALKFDMEGFGKLMQRIEAIDYGAFDVDPATMSDEDMGMMAGKPLITPYIGYSIESANAAPDGMQRFPLPMRTGDQEYHHGRSSVMSIPATSAKQELALRFIRSYMDNMASLEKAAVSAAWEEPIPNPNFEQELKDEQAHLASYEKLFAQAEEGAAKRQYAKDIENVKKGIERVEQTRKFLLDKKGIEAHRAYMAGTYVDNSLTLTQRSALSKDGYLFHMYTQGTLSIEQFMQQANDKIRLMTLEMQ